MWTLEQAKRLQKYVDQFDEYGADFHYGKESDPDAYPLGDGIPLN